MAPTELVLSVLRSLTVDTNNKVCLFSSRLKSDLTEWFASVVSVARG